MRLGLAQCTEIEAATLGTAAGDHAGPTMLEKGWNVLDHVLEGIWYEWLCDDLSTSDHAVCLLS